MTVTTKQDKHVVAIFEDDGDYIVAPGQLIAKVGDVVCFQNLTGVSVIIQFPNKELFETDELTLDHSMGESRELVNPQPGANSYSVYCDGEKACASKPRIIIYRKIFL